jgi:hypothetical protein
MRPRTSREATAAAAALNGAGNASHSDGLERCVALPGRAPSPEQQQFGVQAVKRVLKHAGLLVVSLFFAIGGQAHFTSTAFFVSIVPPYVPFPLATVYVTGVLELIVGRYRPRDPDGVRDSRQHLHVDEPAALPGHQPESSRMAAGYTSCAAGVHLVVDPTGAADATTKGVRLSVLHTSVDLSTVTRSSM